MNKYHVIYDNGALLDKEVTYVDKNGYECDKSFLEYLIYHATKLEDNGFNVKIAIKLTLLLGGRVEYNKYKNISYLVSVEWENDINKPKSIEGAELYYENIRPRCENLDVYGCQISFDKK